MTQRIQTPTPPPAAASAGRRRPVPGRGRVYGGGAPCAIIRARTDAATHTQIRTPIHTRCSSSRPSQTTGSCSKSAPAASPDKYSVAMIDDFVAMSPCDEGSELPDFSKHPLSAINEPSRAHQRSPSKMVRAIAAGGRAGLLTAVGVGESRAPASRCGRVAQQVAGHNPRSARWGMLDPSPT